MIRHSNKTSRQHWTFFTFQPFRMTKLPRFTATLICLGCLVCVNTLVGQMSQQVAAQDIVYRGAMAKAVRNAANRLLPSVVTVEIIGAVGQASGEVEQDAPTSGIVIDPSGFVLASSIVTKRPSASILVVLPDRTRHAAKVVAQDEHRELVLLQIKTDKPLTAAALPDTLDLRVGQTTIAVGRYGADASPIVSSGILSAVQRLDGIALQTDARVSPAFYGGPLIDLAGNLLGVLVPAVAPGGAPDETSWYDSGVAFAIPADVIRSKIQRLKDGEDIKKGLIGIVPKSDDPLKEGTELAAVRTRSPAEKAGLKPGDSIRTIAGQSVKRFQQIKQVLGSYDAGEVIAIEFMRQDKPQRVEIELVDSIPPLQPQRIGIIAREDAAASQDVDDGEDADEDEQQVEGEESDDDGLRVVVDAVVPGSAADGILKPEDVIVQVDGSAVTDVQSMRRMMVSAESEMALKLTIIRDEKESEVSVTPQSVAGEVADDVPPAWETPSEKEWKVSPLKLPDVGNEAAFVGPTAKDEVAQLGLLVMLLNPGQGKPEKVLESWPNLARKHGVVVCAIAPSENERWRPKEIDVVSRFAAAILKQVDVEQSAVAVAAAGALDGGKPEAADSMALAVAISASETFNGVAISHESRPPAIRLKENKADASLQLLLPIKTSDDMPTWGTALEKAGYPIIFGGATDGDRLLKWVRLLQAV